MSINGFKAVQHNRANRFEANGVCLGFEMSQAAYPVLKPSDSFKVVQV